MEAEFYFFDGNGFIPAYNDFNPDNETDLKGTWVSADVFNNFIKAEKPGYKSMADADGYPVWVKLTEDELLEQSIPLAVDKKKKEMSYASAVIAPLQDASDLDDITADEKAKLLRWKKYRIELNRIDTNLGHHIVWPERPAE